MNMILENASQLDRRCVMFTGYPTLSLPMLHEPTLLARIIQALDE